ncbi:MAG TPA: hypothetical protein PLS19_03955 [bacterium]|nr:hypothetical protein [bacterium]HPN93699.1 hypothetical protein [bacterium]
MAIKLFLKTVIFLFTIQVAYVATALANHSWTIDGVGGSVRVLDTEHESVIMVREWVRMDVYDDYYTVKAQFVFHNDGPPTDVMMGFPERNDTYELSKYEGFLWFNNWVDGKKVDAVRTRRMHEEGYPLDEDGQPIDGELVFFDVYLWKIRVGFDQNQTRTIRVEYKAKAGKEAFGSRIAEYNFTGQNWRDNVKEANFLAVLHLSGTNRIWIASPLCLRMKDNRLSGKWVDWPAQAHLRINYAPTLEEAINLSFGKRESETDKSCLMDGVLFSRDKVQEVMLPQALVDNGNVYIRSQAFYRILPKCSLEGVTTSKFSVECKSRKATFIAEESTIDVNGEKQEVLLSPFFRKIEKHHDSDIYVPAKATIELLGGQLEFDDNARRAWIDIAGIIDN